MYIKICGITKPEQGVALAELGVDGLGFVCVPSSPRYVDSEQIRVITYRLPSTLDRVGVFLDASVQEITQVVRQSGLTGIQLHGNESPQFCYQLKSELPDIKVIKALNIKIKEALGQADFYSNWVDVILLDAYDPKLAGGTGKTIDWSMLEDFRPSCPWWLAGGLSTTNITEALHRTKPQGVDLSSGVERSPGDKDLDKVQQFINLVQKFTVNIV